MRHSSTVLVCALSILLASCGVRNDACELRSDGVSCLPGLSCCATTTTALATCQPPEDCGRCARDFDCPAGQSCCAGACTFGSCRLIDPECMTPFDCPTARPVCCDGACVDSDFECFGPDGGSGDDAGPRDGGADGSVGSDGGMSITEGPVTVLTDGEALTFVPDLLFGASGPRVLIAGAGVAMYAADTGAVIEEWADAASTYYRAVGFILQGPLGSSDSVVSVGRDGFAIRSFTPGSGFSAFQQLGGTGINVTDVVPMPADGTGVSAGFFWVDNTSSQVNTYSSLTSMPPAWTSTQLGMTGATGRAVAFDPGVGSNPDLVLTTEELLVGSGTTIRREATLLSPSGGFRDIVREGDLCALSDFPTRVVIFDCGAPGSQASITVAGPVGLDIRGNRVLASGSMDGSIHDITWTGSTATEVVHDVSAIAPSPSWVRFYPGMERAAFSGGGVYGTVSLE